jgi:hypothetical protein
LDARFADAYAEDNETRNVLCVPMRNEQGEIIGVVQLVNKLPATASFDKDDEDLMEAFAQMISSIIHRSKVLIDVDAEFKRSQDMNQYFSALLQSTDTIFITINEDTVVMLVNQRNLFDLLSDSSQSAITVEDIFGQCDLTDDVNCSITMNRTITVNNACINIGGTESFFSYTITPCTSSGDPYLNNTRFPRSQAILARDGKHSAYRSFLIRMDPLQADRRMVHALCDAIPFIPPRELTNADNTVISKFAGILPGCKQDIAVFQISLVYEPPAEEFAPAGDHLCAMINSFFQLTGKTIHEEAGIIVNCSDTQLTSIFLPTSFEKQEPPQLLTQKAVLCAFKLQAPLDKWVQEQIAMSNLPHDCMVSIAVSTGTTILGMMGWNEVKKLNIHGGPNAMASHLNSQAVIYGTQIMVDEKTRGHLPDSVSVREVDLTVLPIPSSDYVKAAEKMYEIVGLGELSADRQGSIESYELGLMEYRQLNWNSAMIQFKKVGISFEAF